MVDNQKLNEAVNKGNKEEVKAIIKEAVHINDEDFNKAYDSYYNKFKERNIFSDDEKLVKACLVKTVGFFKKELSSSAKKFIGFPFGIKIKNWSKILIPKAKLTGSVNANNEPVYWYGFNKGEVIPDEDWETEIYFAAVKLEGENDITNTEEFLKSNIEIKPLVIRKEGEKIELNDLGIDLSTIYNFRANENYKEEDFLHKIKFSKVTRFEKLDAIDFARTVPRIKELAERVVDIKGLVDWCQQNVDLPEGDQRRFDDFVILGKKINKDGKPYLEGINVTSVSPTFKGDSMQTELEDDSLPIEEGVMKSLSDLSVPINFNADCLNTVPIGTAWMPSDGTVPVFRAMGYWTPKEFRITQEEYKELMVEKETAKPVLATTTDLTKQSEKPKSAVADDWANPEQTEKPKSDEKDNWVNPAESPEAVQDEQEEELNEQF